MERFERDILNKLLDKYEKSVLSKQGSSRNLKIELVVGKDKELKSYKGLDAALYRKDNDTVIRKLEKLSFIIAKCDEEDYFESLRLNADKVNDIYSYLRRDNPKDMLMKIREVLSCCKVNEVISNYKSYLLNYMETQYDYPKFHFTDADQLKNILICLYYIYMQEEEIMERDFSVLYLNDTKAFAPISLKVCNIIRGFDDNIPYTKKDEILAYFNIVKNSTYAMIKNNLVFKLNDVVIDLNKLRYEYLLSDEMIRHIDIQQSIFKRVITVENLTSFHQFEDKDAVVIYLAGFHNHTKKMLLDRIYEKYPEVEYDHFGDIDAGGFIIYNHLKDATGIPFKAYRMDKKELEENFTHLKKLTDNDKKRLTSMLSNPKFRYFYNTIEYMLEHNVKLEQEILD